MHCIVEQALITLLPLLYTCNKYYAWLEDKVKLNICSFENSGALLIVNSKSPLKHLPQLPNYAE